MQAVPKQIDFMHLEKNVLNLSGVKAVHDIHVWSLDGEFNVASLHLVLDNPLNTYNAEEVKREVRSVFSKEGVKHVTIELEGPEEDCEMEDCVD